VHRDVTAAHTGTLERLVRNCGMTTQGVGTAIDLPVWVVALLLGATAPWGVRALQLALEWRIRRRTLEVIAQAQRESRPEAVNHPRRAEP